MKCINDVFYIFFPSAMCVVRLAPPLEQILNEALFGLSVF
jgi:hypothetical protein